MYCLKCGTRLEYGGRESSSVYEVVRRYECPECGWHIYDVDRDEMRW